MFGLSISWARLPPGFGARRVSSDATTRLAAAVVGVVVLVGLWHLAGTRAWFGGAVPTPGAVWSTMTEPVNRRLFRRAVAATLPRTAWGLAFGGGAALALAIAPVLAPQASRTVQRVAATVQALPVIVLGPVLVSLVSADRVPVIIAALASFFAMFVPATAALSSVRDAHLDYMASAGASRVQRLLRLHLPAAAPGIATGLRLAAPAAILGAVFGEWFGADTGLGPVLVTSMRNVRIPMLWSCALIITAMSAIGYGVGTLLELRARSMVR